MPETQNINLRSLALRWLSSSHNFQMSRSVRWSHFYHLTATSWALPKLQRNMFQPIMAHQSLRSLGSLRGDSYDISSPYLSPTTLTCLLNMTLVCQVWGRKLNTSPRWQLPRTELFPLHPNMPNFTFLAAITHLEVAVCYNAWLFPECLGWVPHLLSSCKFSFVLKSWTLHWSLWRSRLLSRLSTLLWLIIFSPSLLALLKEPWQPGNLISMPLMCSPTKL